MVERAKSPLGLLNGQIQNLDDIRISPLDRGFLFGDGVYEVMRIYSGRPFLASEHFARLKHSLDQIRISGVGPVEEWAAALIKAAGEGEASIYIQVTRGAGPRRHGFLWGMTPTVFMFVTPYVDKMGEERKYGAEVCTVADRRWQRCDIKSVNLLANVLANQTAMEQEKVEALLVDEAGQILEASHSSIFWVQDGVLMTTPQSHRILPGITRDFVVQLAQKAGIPFHPGALYVRDLGRIEEFFLTATTTEVLPIVRIDQQAVGDGKPGKKTLHLQALHREAVAKFRTAEK